MKRADETHIGKLPPQAKQLEVYLLGAIMLESDCLSAIIPIIKTDEVFYADAHQRIYRAMMQLSAKNKPIDLETVIEQLKANADLDKVGGVYYIATLTNSVGSAANAEAWARMIVEKYIQRELIHVCNELSCLAYEDTTDVFDLRDAMGKKFDRLVMLSQTQSNQTFAGRVSESVQVLKDAANQGNYITGVQTFSPRLDRNLMGFQPTDLIIIAARPAMGKTSIALHIALNQAKNGIPVGFFSLEMNDRQLINKLLSSETNIDLKKVRSGGMKYDEWQTVDAVAEEMKTWPFYLDDTGAIDIQTLIATSRVWVKKHGVKIIYLDYIQLVTSTEKSRGSREQEVSYISSKLKALAKELKIPIVALAQLSRGPESRPDKRAMLSDLRESGAIEQDADIVIFPFRPEYYGIETDSEGMPYVKGFTELGIAKFRNGQPGKVPWVFLATKSKFVDYNEDELLEQQMNYESNKSIRTYHNYSEPNEKEVVDEQPF
jgi:replicative DNA helicase